MTDLVENLPSKIKEARDKAVTQVKSDIMGENEEINKICEMLLSKPDFQTYQDTSL